MFSSYQLTDTLCELLETSDRLRQNKNKTKKKKQKKKTMWVTLLKDTNVREDLIA